MPNCFKCGTEIAEETLFCRGCGTRLINDGQINNAMSSTRLDINQTSNNNAFRNHVTSQNICDEELIKLFIGERSDKILNLKGGSIWAFLSGPSYLVYRKLYLYGIIWLILSFFIPSGINYILLFVVAFSFKKIYLSHVKKNVDKIKQENMDKEELEIKNICRKKGGTNAFGWALCIVLALITNLYPALNSDYNANADNSNEKLNINTNVNSIENTFMSEQFNSKI